MPQRPPVFRPPFLKPRAQAEAERKRVLDAKRPSATDRGYDADWRKTRKLFIAQHPMCSEPGCSEFTHDVDHIKSVRERPDLRLRWSNLRPYCRSHHSARTARDQGFGKAKKDSSNDR